MIKVGQIYKSKNVGNIYIVTCSHRYDNKSYVISNKGKGSLRYDIDIQNMILLAEYPTWQEAVNSKEFKGE